VSHDLHFLERLPQRLDPAQMDFALRLYRDVEGMRWMAARASLPEGTQRFAFSLRDPQEGPFVLATPEGRFVTCLAEGMRPGGIPVLNRDRLDSLMSQLAEYRRREGCAPALDEGESWFALFRRLGEAGPGVSREDFAAASFLASLTPSTLADSAVRCLARLPKLRAAARDLRRDVLDARRVFGFYVNQVHALGHLWLLGLMDGERLLEVAGEASRTFLLDVLRLLLLEQTVAGWTRALWIAARHGRRCLPLLREVLEAPSCEPELRFALQAMECAALAHSKLRPEVERCFDRVLQRGQTGAQAPVRGGEYAKAWVLWMREPGDAASSTRAAAGAARRALSGGKALEAGGGPTGLEDVPDAVVLAAYANLTVDPEQNDALWIVRHALPWLSRARAEDLYVPGDFLSRFPAPDPVEEGRALLQRRRERVTTQEATGAAPPRNAPCPCGSGAKYKRCCGR